MGAWLSACAAAWGDAVELRATARVERLPVVLSDIADLRGPGAQALASTPVAGELPEGAWATIDPASVRAALEALPPGRVDWTNLTLKGGAVRVRLLPAQPAPTQASAPTPASEREPEYRPAPGTVGALVPARLADFLAATLDGVRVEFSRADSAILDLSAEGRAVEIRPGALSDRVPMTITVYEGERIIARGSARAGVSVRRQAATARRELRRGEPLTPDAFELADQWLSPAVRPATAGELEGALARGRIRAGRVILPADLEAPEAVKKGDLVWVHTVSGGLSLKRLSRAREDGRVGDVIAFEPADPGTGGRGRAGGEGREYRARVSGPGEAVIDLGRGREESR